MAISLLAGLQTIPQSLNEAAALDGATAWQRFRRVTLEEAHAALAEEAAWLARAVTHARD